MSYWIDLVVDLLAINYHFLGFSFPKIFRIKVIMFLLRFCVCFCCDGYLKWSFWLQMAYLAPSECYFHCTETLSNSHLLSGAPCGNFSLLYIWKDWYGAPDNNYVYNEFWWAMIIRLSKIYHDWYVEIHTSSPYLVHP